jgi:hypothetical protein
MLAQQPTFKGDALRVTPLLPAGSVRVCPYQDLLPLQQILMRERN